jgi:alpha-ketoglutarate-dependent 2,4-dichlorophenoxyacetate dioxygenase
MVETTNLTPILGARITGLDIARGVGATTMAALRDAPDRFSVLVFPDQRIDDAAQIAFTEGFGPLERTRPDAPGAGSAVVILSNIGPVGEIAPPTDKQVLNNKANRAWHHDSSFKPMAARASLLSRGRFPRPEGTPHSPLCAPPSPHLIRPSRPRCVAALPSMTSADRARVSMPRW